MGVTGIDLIEEGKTSVSKDVTLLSRLGFGKANVVIAVPDHWIDVENIRDLSEVSSEFRSYNNRRMRVATKFSNITRNFLIRNLDLNENKVVKIDNPIISKKMRILSFEKIDKEDLFIFEKKVFCSIGRLTRQKNYLELIKAFENF